MEHEPGCKNETDRCNVDNNCDNCAYCCPEHTQQCNFCYCYPDDDINDCREDGECMCHGDVMSDKEERAAERKQMGITS